jgi:hypothetical protein
LTTADPNPVVEILRQQVSKDFSKNDKTDQIFGQREFQTTSLLEPHLLPTFFAER